jgi:hypothetical protein
VFGRNVHRIGRVSPALRAKYRIDVVSSIVFSRSTPGTPGSGTASGLATWRLALTRTRPWPTWRSLLSTRRASRPEAAGRRMPMEFTHRIRFLSDRIRMMCVLLVGSPCQSWAKQMIDSFRII